MLLFSALYLTIIVIFIKPTTHNSFLGFAFPSWWDPHIALGVFPVLALMLITIPESLAPMIYTLSVEVGCYI